MESVGSNSPAEHDYDPDTHLTERIVRALSHHLALLHRTGPNFYVLGATGNVYTVTISLAGNACTCPDRTVPCKHIFFVLLRVLGLPPDDPCLHRRAPRPCQVAYLLSLPTAANSLAGLRARERFHQVFVRGSPSAAAAEDSGKTIEEGELCPVCLDELVSSGSDDVVTCGTCGNSLHGECLKRWKSSRGRRAASCVMCRAKWRQRREVEKYVNLSAYVGEDDTGEGGWGLCARL